MWITSQKQNKTKAHMKGKRKMWKGWRSCENHKKFIPMAFSDRKPQRGWAAARHYHWKTPFPFMADRSTCSDVWTSGWSVMPSPRHTLNSWFLSQGQVRWQSFFSGLRLKTKVILLWWHLVTLHPFKEQISSFVPQIIMEHQLSARHCSSHLEHSSKYSQQRSLPLWRL